VHSPHRRLDAFGAWISAHQPICLIVICWTFLLTTCFRAQHSFFWYDELLTVKISALPHLADIWAALRTGLDQNPPFSYVAVHAIGSALGESPLSVRLPMILGVLLMSVCIFFYLRSRVPVPLAFAGMILPWLTETYRFSLNARPYGILLGAGGVVFLCWIRAAELSRRRTALAGLAVALAIAFSTHVYTILLVIPLAFGELARLLERRKPDWPMWMAMAAGALPLAMYPILRAAAGDAHVHDSSVLRVSAASLLDAYRGLLSPLFWPLLLGAVLLFGLTRLNRQGTDNSVPGAFFAPSGQSSQSPVAFLLPPYEWAALTGYALTPLFSVGIAALTTRVFFVRYGCLGVIGIVCLLAIALPPRKTASIGAVLAALLLACFGLQFVAQFYWATRGQSVDLLHFFPASPAIVEAAATPTDTRPSAGAAIPGHPLLRTLPAGDLPLVISSGLAFLELDYYLPDSLVTRTYYLADPVVAMRRTGLERFDTSYPKFKRSLHLRGNVEAAADFLAQHRTFLVYSPGYLVEWRAPDEWLLPELESRGWSIRPIARSSRALLAEVTAP
jgi:hypothetical protein